MRSPEKKAGFLACFFILIEVNLRLRLCPRPGASRGFFIQVGQRMICGLQQSYGRHNRYGRQKYGRQWKGKQLNGIQHCRLTGYSVHSIISGYSLGFFLLFFIMGHNSFAEILHNMLTAMTESNLIPRVTGIMY